MPSINKNHPALVAIHHSLVFEQWIKLGIGLLFASLGIAGLMAWWGHLVLTVLFIACLGGALFFLKTVVSEWNLERNKLMSLLYDRPEQIVWVYSVVTRRMPFGFEWSRNGTMYFKLIDGSEITVMLPAKHLKYVSAVLNKLLPHATFGFSRDREQWYMASPELLIREVRRKK